MVDAHNNNNAAKFVKKDLIERKNHESEDISYKLSPYTNRVPIAESYKSNLGYKAINQTLKPMRNQGQK